MRTYPWRLLTPLPLVAALAGLVAVSVWTWIGVTAATRMTQVEMLALTGQSRRTEYVWVGLAEQRTATAEILAAGTANAADLRSVEIALEDVHRRLVAVGSFALTPTQRGAYRRLQTADIQALPLEQRLLHAVATGRVGQAQAIWQELNPALRGAEDDAHLLLHATDVAFSPRMAALMAAEVRHGRRMLFLAFGLVAAEFAAISMWAGHVVARPLACFSQAAASVRRGDLDVDLPSSPIQEFTALAQGFRAMVTSLRAMRAAEQDVHQQALTLREARAAMVQRHLDLIIQAQEEERRRVARDLHDEAAQALTAVHLGLQHLAHQVGAPARSEVESLAALARETMDTVRNLAQDLHPHALDELGLLPALEDWVGRVGRRSGADVRLEACGEWPRLALALETAAFRIAQEAVTNALRHAQAHTVCVRLGVDAGAFVLEVADDGTGFVVHRTEGGVRGMGLFNMEQRARHAGGLLTIWSRPGGGTRVRLRVPVGGSVRGADAAAVAAGGERGLSLAPVVDAAGGTASGHLAGAGGGPCRGARRAAVAVGTRGRDARGGGGG